MWKRDEQPSQRGNRSSTSSGIINLSKSYILDSDQYNYLPIDNFDWKLSLLNERCDQASLDDDEKHLAFSIRLVCRARDFYFDNLRGKNVSFEQMTVTVIRRFITAEYERTLVRE